MKHRFNYTKLCVLLGLMACLYSCRFNPTQGIEWDADILAPIAFSTVTVNDAIQDSTLITTGDENVMTLVFRDSVAGSALSDFVELPDTTEELVVTLDSLSLDTGPIEERVTLADIGRQLKEQGNIFGDVILQGDGQVIPILPSQTGLSSGEIPVDATEFFEEAQIESGFLKLTIENQLPLDLENAIFNIENATGPPPIILDTFTIIPKGTQVERLYDVSGMTIESQLLAALVNIDITGGVNILIDTTDFISIRLEPVDLKVFSATAIFPEQTILDSTSTTRYKFPTEFADIQLTKIKIKSGKISARSVSTIQDTIRFTYSLPSATRNGEIPSISLKLNPSPDGTPVTQVQETGLDGFELDMTLGGTTFNSIEQAYKVDLVYSGKIVTLSKEDSVKVEFGLLEIEPTYVEGYLGKDQFVVEGQEAIDIFDMIDVSRLEFKSPKASIVFANSVGVNSQIVINEITAKNSETNKAIDLYGSAMRSGPITVPGPAFGDTFGVALTRIEFDAVEGNLDDFVNVMPDQLAYDILINANYDGMPGVHDNFATIDSEIEAFVEFELPLEGIVEELVLKDTASVSFNSSTSGDIEEINGGKLRIIVENQFPMEATVTAIIYDENWNEVDVITTGGLLEAGVPNPVSGFVDDPVTSQVEKSFDNDLLDEIIQTAKYIVFDYRLSTRPEDTHVRVYADYEITARLVGEFNYSLKY